MGMKCVFLGKRRRWVRSATFERSTGACSRSIKRSRKLTSCLLWERESCPSSSLAVCRMYAPNNRCLFVPRCNQRRKAQFSIMRPRICIQMTCNLKCHYTKRKRCTFIGKEAININKLYLGKKNEPHSDSECFPRGRNEAAFLITLDFLDDLLQLNASGVKMYCRGKPFRRVMVSCVVKVGSCQRCWPLYSNSLVLRRCPLKGRDHLAEAQ